MNQAALWAGIILAVLGAAKLGYAAGKYPNERKLPASAAFALVELSISIIFFYLAYK